MPNDQIIAIIQDTITKLQSNQSGHQATIDAANQGVASAQAQVDAAQAALVTAQAQAATTATSEGAAIAEDQVAIGDLTALIGQLQTGG